MDTPTIVNIILCILSFLLAAISVVTVIITLRQNHKLIEGSTRPVLSFYTTSINVGGSIFYFVVRNYGASTAIIEKISSEQDFTQFLFAAGELGNAERFDPIHSLKKAVIAPGQSRICALDYKRTPEEIAINVEYKSYAGKKYKEQVVLTPKAGVGMISTKAAGKKDDLTSQLEKISYTLQEMLQKGL